MAREALRAYWTDFWFQPSPPTALALCRILLFGALFFFYRSTDFGIWSDVDRAFWMPIPLFDRLAVPPPSRTITPVLEAVWSASLALACIGLFTRMSTAVAFFLGLYLLGLPHNFGAVHHGDAVIPLVFGIMAVSRCGDRWAVDRVLRARRSGAHTENRSASDAEYTWPIRAVWVTLVLIYFAAGIAKLRHGGMEWITSDNLALRVTQSYYGIAHADPLTPWGLQLAQYRWVCRALAGITVAVELSYPVALISARLRYVLVPTVVLLQVGIRLTLGPSFAPVLVCHLFWVPWAAMADQLGRAAGSSPIFQRYGGLGRALRGGARLRVKARESRQ